MCNTLNISLSVQSFRKCCRHRYGLHRISRLIMGWQLIRCAFRCPALNAAPMFTRIIVNDNREAPLYQRSKPARRRRQQQQGFFAKQSWNRWTVFERTAIWNESNKCFTEPILFLCVCAFVWIVRDAALCRFFFLPSSTFILISRDIWLKWKLPPCSYCSLR